MRVRPSGGGLFAILTVAVAVALGCDDQASEPSETSEPSGAPAGSRDEGAEGEAEPEGPGEPAKAVGVAGDSFEWSERPSFGAIPEVPVGGVVRGAAFDVQSVYFEPRFGQWALVLSDATLEAPTDPPPPDAQSLTVTELPAHLGEGEHRREMREVGGSLWRIRTDGGAEPTTWSAPHAFVLEIEQWETDPWDPEGPLFQQAGRASGRIAVVHRASDGLGRAWVAGRFEDATIRYMGKPGWLEEAP